MYDPDFDGGLERDFSGVPLSREQVDKMNSAIADRFMLNEALNYAVEHGIITDSEADHLENIFARGQA